jgi:hypothetical protein
LKLNLGCGFNKVEGFVNVDAHPLCNPDVVFDLEQFPWPWADNSVSEILAIHSLEHMGRTTEIWFGIIKEIYRICQPDARLKIAVPHPRHENFLHDPTHVRVITPTGIAMFDQTRNLGDLQRGGSETKLGLLNGIDLEVLDVGYRLEDAWRARLDSGEMTLEQVGTELNERNNLCSETRILARVVKPGRGEDWIRQQQGLRHEPVSNPHAR